MTAEPPTERRHDLDWLRVLAILLLLYFHTGMIFVAEWGWHIKNPETSSLLLEVNYFLSRWRMALLFLISGVGTWYALRRRSAGEYSVERVKRLLAPVVFGMLVIVPPQIYLERVSGGAAYGSYLDFYPSVLELRPYPQGSLSYHHLWFVFYLFLYSLCALPLFLWLDGERGRAWLRRANRVLRGGGLYVPALPLGATLAALVVRFPGPQDVVHDWASLLYYLLFFVFGYVLSSAGEVWNAVERQRRTSLTLAFLCMLAISYLRWNGRTPEFEYSVANTLYYLLQGLNAWCWVLAILGFGKRHLNVRTHFLDYASEGIYPFYILHQTVIVVVGFYVVQVEESILAKYLFVSTVSLLVSWGIYDLLVKPFPVVRFLFGMKPARRRPESAALPATGTLATGTPRLEAGAPGTLPGRPAA